MFPAGLLPVLFERGVFEDWPSKRLEALAEVIQRGRFAAVPESDHPAGEQS